MEFDPNIPVPLVMFVTADEPKKFKQNSLFAMLSTNVESFDKLASAVKQLTSNTKHQIKVNKKQQEIHIIFDSSEDEAVGGYLLRLYDLEEDDDDDGDENKSSFGK